MPNDKKRAPWREKREADFAVPGAPYQD